MVNGSPAGSFTPIRGYLRHAGDPSVPFIELSEQRTVIHDIPDAVGHFFEANVLAAEDLAEEGLSAVKAKGACGADATDLEVRGIGGQDAALGIRTGRRRPE